jgi:hypothetical protein
MKTVRAVAVRSPDVDTRTRGRRGCGARVADEEEKIGGRKGHGGDGAAPF